MAVYSIDDLVGKTLFGTRDVNIKRSAFDSAPTVYTVKKGTPIGRLYSWLNAGPGADSVYFMFYDTNNRPYYVKGEPKIFSLEALKDQGLKSVEEKAKEESKSNETTKDFIERLLKYGIVAIAATVILKQIIAK